MRPTRYEFSEAQLKALKTYYYGDNIRMPAKSVWPAKWTEMGSEKPLSLDTIRKSLSFEKLSDDTFTGIDPVKGAKWFENRRAAEARGMLELSK